MTTQELAALARGRLALIHDRVPAETAYDDVANAIQILLGAEAAFEALGLIGNGDDAAAEVRQGLRAIEARLFKALFKLGSAS